MALEADHAGRLRLFDELRFEFFGGETEDDVHLGTAARADGVAVVAVGAVDGGVEGLGLLVVDAFEDFEAAHVLHPFGDEARTSAGY